MKALITIIFLFFMRIPIPPTADLTVVIKNIEDVKGSIHMGLYNNAASYLKLGEEFRVVNFKITATTMSYTFKNIPLGVYGISLYQDANNDGECNRNWIGYPTEAYGFSNNIKVHFSAPKFEDAKFWLKNDTTITISIIN